MNQELAAKHVMVTGGTGGLGVAVVKHLLEAGATCHVPCVEAIPPTHMEWAASPHVVLTGGVDLTDEAATTAYVASLPPLWGAVQLAGGFAMAPIAETTLDLLRRQLELNVVSCFLSCREAVQSMRRGGGGGRLVNVVARPVLKPVAGMTAYAVAKAGVTALTQTLAEEVKDEGILVNAIVPSIIDTPANRAAMPEAPHDTWPKAAELANTIGFLLSPRNRLTHGALVPVYGRG